MKHQKNWAVIFDLDGAMVDNALFHQNAWIELCKRHDIDITPEYYRTYIHAKCNERNVKTLFGDNVSDDLIGQISFEKETIYRDTYRPVIKEIFGLTALLEKLNAARVPIAVASNSPKANVDFVLDELDIRNFFDVILDRDQVTTGKPNPEGLLTVASQLNIPASACIVIEDSPSGFKAAQNADMPYVAIKAGSAQDWQQAQNAAAIYEDFTTIEPQTLLKLLM